MPTADQALIEADRAHPRITELWWALRPLTSVVRFMQTGAHPDDEISGMLAALAFRDGINISYACSTRGEGGQNDIGTEAGAALGALRTREMERACDVLRMKMYWHSETPDDPISDFGFSKSGKETLGRWGHARTMARFVEIVRTEKPDILCPTFLDVPGQHGHHRAMTQAAHEAMVAAADPEFPSNLAPWQVRKLFLPAWSGAGQAYDDDLPPPPATLTVDGSGGDPVTGWSWERIGQQSRAFHRTQGMGRWIPSDHPPRHWPLHLAESHVPEAGETLTSGLPNSLGDLARFSGADGLATELIKGQSAIEDAIAAFPDFNRVARHGIAALKAVRRAREACPDDLRGNMDHRLAAKETQLGHVLRLALGVDVKWRVGETFLVSGQSVPFSLEVGQGDADGVDIGYDLPHGWSVADGQLRIGDAVSPSEPYRAIYDPSCADAPCCEARISVGGVSVSVRLPMDAPPMVLPDRMVRVTPDAALINLTVDTRSFSAQVNGVHPYGAALSLELPEGWHASSSTGGIDVTLPRDVPAGLYEVPVHLDGQPAKTVQRIEHAHTAPTVMSKPAVLRVLALDAALPDVKVGYVGAGNDRVGYWLAAMGADVEDLTDTDLGSDEALARFDTIVVGIFALRFRAGLSAAMPRLHNWARAGGTLVTLYHRPWDNWDPDHSAPFRLEIGQPSLRWRVTNEAAEVQVLADHSLLSSPNVIGPEDWNGWVKERGLYFAKSWDANYTPLIEMADPDEEPHRGALLVADVGKGRHVHTSLILHHQMENLVSGAFRIMANILSKRA